jgi:DNA-binding GntR family transcriptional regulator
VKDRAGKNIEKMTSKKDFAVNSIKKYLKDNNLSSGDTIIPIRELAKIINVSTATVRSAIMSLVLQGVLKKEKRVFVLTSRSFRTGNISTKTLVEKVAANIKKYIIDNLKPGDKLPTNQELVKMYGVSLKTIHDAVKLLSKEGIVYTRRGQYGTVVMSITEGTASQQYNYEKIEKSIKHYITSNCKVGDKIPSIKAFANMYSTSEKTVKKALDNISEDGFVTFIRGRYGGTFVTEIPPSDKDAYTWLAINSEYIRKNSN